LSDAEADQFVTSPCIDAGSTLASESTVGCLTTRTDHERDTGVLDMGFHYGARIGRVPRINLSFEQASVARGNDLEMVIELLGTCGVLVDAYLAVVHGNDVLYLTQAGWTMTESVWIGRVPIRSSFVDEDAIRFSLYVPYGIETGTYTVFIGLFECLTQQLVALAQTDFEIVQSEGNTR